MRVLFICGKGNIERAIPVVQKKLNGAIELDTLGSLDELDRYFAKGHMFDKCLVLSPDRLIANYTHDLLEGEMAKFKSTIRAKCPGLVDIVLCVTKEEDGMELAEQFSDMLGGYVTIIKVDEKLAMATLVDLIRQQGSTLAKKFKSFDLATIAKEAAKETLKEQEDLQYRSLNDIVKQVQEETAPEEYITSMGTEEDNFGSDMGDSFNTDGFDTTADAGTFGSDVEDSFSAFGSSGDNDVTDMFSGFGDMGNDKDDTPLADMDSGSGLGMAGGVGTVDDDPSSLFSDFGSNGSGYEDTSAFGSFDEPGQSGDLNSLGSSDSSDSSGDEEDINTVVQPVKKTNTKKKVPVDDGLGALAGVAGVGAGAGVAANKANKQKPAKSGGLFGGSKKTEDKADKAVKPDKIAKSGGLFGGSKKKEAQEDVYEMAEDKKPAKKKESGVGFFVGKSAKTQEVSNKKNVGLNRIAKQQEEEDEFNTFEEEAVEESHPDVIEGTGAILAAEYEAQNTPASSGDLIESMFEMDASSKKEIEKGNGTGLNPAQLSSGRKKAGKKITKELQEMLKPYLKRGGLFVVTGSNGTGKTVISANIANLLCRYGYRVCVLDLDLQGKGQSYLNLDTFRTVHGGFQQKMNSVSVVNSTGTDFAKWTDVVRSGYHMITTTLNSDVEETHKLVRNTNMGRLVRQLTGAYNFVVVDVPFRDLVNYYKDFADTADAIICVEEATQRGLTNFMLNMINIEDEDVENTMFNRVSLVLNKEDGMKSFFGRKVNSTSDILVTMDDTVAALAQQIIDYSFTDIPVISILKYSNAYERFWYTNKYITDTKEGEKLFSDLLQNALNN